jgi:hypothetical protein
MLCVKCNPEPNRNVTLLPQRLPPSMQQDPEEATTTTTTQHPIPPTGSNKPTRMPPVAKLPWIKNVQS